ncbi:MAG: HPr family phosphocarrier protein [Chitinophagaceae bacterium]|nr:HPr family phosphocarrier protein [Chitinophagaceae bacterium]
MISKDYIIMAPEGIHARPATTLIRLTKKFKSVVSLKKEDKVVRLNSMLNILSMGAKGGDTISILIEGEDELDAAEAINIFFTEELKNL